MKKIFPVLLFILILAWAVGVNSEGLWAKYVAPGGGYSFHYPKGWKVEAGDSVIEIKNNPTDEQLLMASIPFERQKSPADLAAGFVALLKGDNPNVRASHWQSDPKTRDTQVMFNLYDKSKGKDYNGLGIVIKTANQATWFSYLAPASGYSEKRGAALLQGLIGSVADGAASVAPDIDYAFSPPSGSDTGLQAKMDRNAKAFLFVLEFSLGAPFTQSQEWIIRDELISGWKTRSEAELKPYDQYPGLVQSILKLNQKDLDELRRELEKTVKEWLASSDAADPAVKVIRDQLQMRGRIVIAGNPALTEMALTAYSEIIVYSRLLRQNPLASPEQIPQNSVNDIKKQVRNLWGNFTTKDQQGIATSPGWWICARVLLEHGSRTERDKIRNVITKLSEEPQNSAPKTEPNNTGSNKKPMDMTTHWSLMQMQQMTFNSYMWSRGYNYTITGGKMW